MRNKKNIIMLIMIGIMLLMGTGYAYFSTKLNINVTGNITSTWNVYFESISDGTIVGNASNVITPSVTSTTANMSVNLELPGDSITYELVLKNGGTVGAIIEDIKAEATGSLAIIYTIEGIKVGDKLAGGESKTLTIKIEYDSATSSQPAVTGKTLTVSIDAVQDIGQTIESSDIVIEYPNSLVTAILNDNDEQSDENIDFSQISSDTNGKGLYYTNENTKENKVTYYYRGDVDNNYVKFGNIKRDTCKYNDFNVGYINMTSGEEVAIPTEEQCLSTNVCNFGILYITGLSQTECESMGATYFNEKATFKSDDDILWKIVRINEDGSVRLIFSDNIGTSTFNQGRDNAYAGYMYGTIGSSTYEATHANTNDSEVKKNIDKWYEDNLKNNYSNYLADVGFCNDRSIAPTERTWTTLDTALGYGTKTTYYGAYNRLNNLKQPQFVCPNESNDLFTTKTSSEGNKALDYPIGLITVDEAVYAGGGLNQSNTSYYLFLGGGDYGTMSVSGYYEGTTIEIYYITLDGSITADHYEYALYPVINLKKDVEIISGNGTSTNPYVIKTN